jgi:CheY-like chemotaxis protein
MTEQTRNVEGCLPRIAQRGSCGGEADAFRDVPRRRRDPSAGFHFCGTPLANKGGAVSHTSQDVHLSYDGVVETRTTVLIVDDHPSFRACARAILEADGFAVIGEAEDGQGALSAIDTLTPDVVLLDVQLPDMDGFAVLQRLGTGAPPVVLISSRDACDYDGMIRGSGARGFISKAELSGSAIRSLLR